MAGAALAVVGGYLLVRGEAPAADQTDPSAQNATARTSPPVEAAPAGTPTRSSLDPAATTKQPGTPVRVAVPRLGVSARVLGIRARGGALIPPSNPRLTAWWSEGARPGASKGSAVIIGHTLHNGGGVFDDLDQLRAGDTVTVANAQGTLSYAVVSVAVYRRGALAKQSARLFDQEISGRLVLVTCEDWDGTKYLSNVVVITKPVG